MNGVHACWMEQARDLALLLLHPHDLEDRRTISRQDMRKAISSYICPSSQREAAGWDSGRFLTTPRRGKGWVKDIT